MDFKSYQGGDMCPVCNHVRLEGKEGFDHLKACLTKHAQALDTDEFMNRLRDRNKKPDPDQQAIFRALDGLLSAVADYVEHAMQYTGGNPAAALAAFNFTVLQVLGLLSEKAVEVQMRLAVKDDAGQMRDFFNAMRRPGPP